MTAKKKFTSIICIISLILAVTAGILFSVGAQPNNNYVGGDGVRLSNTDVTINAGSSVKSNEYPADAVAISTSEELQKFIKAEEGFDGYYGYLTADITLDWTGTGSQQILAEDRTLDGNGWTLTLADEDGSTVAGYDSADFVDPLGNGADPEVTDSNVLTYAPKRNYGLLVDYNLGTIKNFKFVYNTSVDNCKTIQNYGDGNNTAAMYSNNVGIVCGTNTQMGRIENCDLTVSGKFSFYYNNGKINDVDTRKNRFETAWGAIAGRNGGVITNITAEYGNFTLDLNTVAQNDQQGGPFSRKGTSAKTMAGGIVGRNALSTAIITNILIISKADTTFSPKLQSTAVRAGSSEGSEKAARYGEFGAVVSANSAYSHGVGESAPAQAKVDNIIVNLNVDLNNASHTMGSTVSSNGVVFCGKATNVTVFNDQINTDNCGCEPGNKGAQHEPGYGNVVHTDEHTNIAVGFDSKGNQIITVTPKAPDNKNLMLGEVYFTKYSGRNGNDGLVDSNNYVGVEDNGATYIYNKVEERYSQYNFKISPYQTSSNMYWEVSSYVYNVATISNSGSSEYTYTGEDFLYKQLNYTTLEGGKSGVVNPEGLNARTEEGKAVTSGRLPGEYAFVLAEKEAGLSYVDTQNKVVAFVEEEPFTQYSFNVNLAQITPLDASLIGENWMKVQQDFQFQLAGGIEGAADGYQYEVGGSQPTPVEGLVMQNRIDTTKAGRTYKIELTSGGIVVTEPYTYTVRIDLNAPTAEILHYEHPADRYYTHNKITIAANDKASGVASIIMNSYDGSSTTPDHSHNIMDEGTLNEDGSYTWRFQDTGRKEIVVTDNVGHSSTIEVNVKIDTTVPTITVDSYYFEEVEKPKTDAEGNPILDENNNPVMEIVTERKEYVSGMEIKSAVYFEANATFGESGGEIRYSLDDGHTWETYDGVLTVKREAYVKFLAVSNTYTHPEDDVYPYPNRYPLANNWNNTTVEVKIQLPKVVITLDDIIIENASKVFDGTDVFNGEIKIRDGFVSDNEINGQVNVTSVKYADINAGDEVGLIIEVFCTDDTKIMDNQIIGAKGAIEKKTVDVTIDSKVKIYGVGLPELTYTQNGMIAGFEENISLYVQKPEGYDGSYELLPQTADGEGYVIALAEGTAFSNYVLGNVTEGRLRVTLAPIDRLVYERGQFTGLDLNNIANRNFEIGFIRSNGNYEKLNVTFYSRDYYFDSSTNSFVDNGYTKLVDDITKAGAGFFKVVISLPEYDYAGELLTNKYVMDESITEFMIKVIDSTIFDVEEEETPSEGEDAKVDNGEQPAVDGDAGSSVGTYEDDGTDTDSTDTVIEMPIERKGDYIAMISIFCAVIMAIAFAIGVARAIVKRAKR